MCLFIQPITSLLLMHHPVRQELLLFRWLMRHLLIHLQLLFIHLLSFIERLHNKLLNIDRYVMKGIAELSSDLYSGICVYSKQPLPSQNQPHGSSWLKLSRFLPAKLYKVRQARRKINFLQDFLDVGHEALLAPDFGVICCNAV